MMIRFAMPTPWLVAGAMALSPSTVAAATAFDCDVPPDHYSSVSQDITGPMTIRGSVRLVEMRSGTHLPVAGARLVSADGRNIAGFQLVAASTDATQFDVLLNSMKGNETQHASATQVPVDVPLSFALSLDDAGKATLSIGDKEFTFDFMPLSGGKGMAFCSTAQFKFTDLVFSGNGGPETAHGH